MPLHDEMVGRVRPLLLIVLGAVGCLLLVACANVVNLLLTRATTRQRELAVRAALGASRMRLLTPFLSESFVLTVAGGLLGVLVASVGVRALLAIEPGGLPRLDEIAVSWPVLAFALAVSLATAMLLGVLAATRAMKTDVFARLKESQRTMRSPAGRRARACAARWWSCSSRSRSSCCRCRPARPQLPAPDAAGPGIPHGAPRHDGARWVGRRRRRGRGAAPAAHPVPRRRRIAAAHAARRDAGRRHHAFPLSGFGCRTAAFLILNGTPPPRDFDEWREMIRNKELAGSAEFRIASAGLLQDDGDSARPGPAASRIATRSTPRTWRSSRDAREEPLARSRSDRPADRVRQHGRRPASDTPSSASSATCAIAISSGRRRRCSTATRGSGRVASRRSRSSRTPLAIRPT